MPAEKILVVDDNEAGRYVKARVLTRAGYHVIQAATGTDGLALVGSEHPALVLLDVSLPDINGIDVCRRIKAGDPAMLVLQTSAAFTGKHDRAAGLVGGADSYLVEPLEPEELTASVEALLRLRRAEQELRASHDSLEKQVGARTVELADANQKLRAEIEQRQETETILRHAQRMDVLGQLTGGIAHDFNNLLAVIIGNLEMLRRRLGPDADPRILANAENAFFGARRAATLTRQLLSFSRRQSLDPKPIRLDRLMKGLATLLRQTLAEDIAIETTVQEGAGPVFADEGELEAAILNLAVNARDAMQKGGKLTIDIRNDTDDTVAICTRDTGRGMSDKVKKYAFEPFFTTKDIGEGTGLGLAQVYGFVTQAGGRVGIDSAEGVGTAVTLTLPRYTGVIRDSGEDEIVAAPGGTATVLVVEDDDHVRAQTSEMLRELGYAVEEVPTAKAALAMLAAKPGIGFLFTDVGLPGGMDGTALALKAVEARPGLKVLLTSGYAPSTPTLLETSFQMLAKPFTFAGLGRAMNEALHKGQRPAVLLVEDEALIRMNASEVLREHGFEVTEAGSAAEARAVIAANGVGAAVIDIGLPDQRGDDLAAEFRKTNPDLAIVIASGASGEKARALFAGDPLTAFADKPYDLNSLAALLRKLRADL